jgi:hypothetical protein
MFGLLETYDQAAQATVLSAKLSNFRAASTGIGVKEEGITRAQVARTHDLPALDQKWEQSW